MTAPRTGFRAKPRPTKNNDAHALNALQVLFDQCGVEEHGTYTDPITEREAPVSRKVLVVVAMSLPDGTYQPIRRIIAEQYKSCGVGVDPALKRLREDTGSVLLSE